MINLEKFLMRTRISCK